MKALILVDIQNDFCPGGALAAKNGDEVVPVANRLARHFDFVIATQDWHPRNHASFASSHEGAEPFEVIDLHGIDQVLWPDHCVQGSKGAELHGDLLTDEIDEVIRKGDDPEVDSYSGFYDNDKKTSTGLSKLLKDKGVDTVYVMGLATDYCVKWTAEDAVREGFDTYVVEDGCRGVDAEQGDAEKAIDEMREAGATIVTSGDITSD